ncbi:Protein FAM107B [Oryzias melastigma]|uniref:Actin-associated protein FAM107A n=1 Tax=Oryzias melastigma TaxID=30732 RepID=A0A3B3B5G1_ORYME|nr:protein FAM107B isoform X1 [Oryzias melastigma]KAF6732276.1 Protein FAM107B [Oryzias melastigma]
MGASYGKKKSYSIDHEPPPKQQCVKNGKHAKGRASAHAELQQHRSESLQRRGAPLSGGIPPPDYLDRDEDGELIKPRKLVNPVKSSRSHQELHRELLSSCKRSGASVETKPELQRVLESRKREQLIRQRKQEDEARRKVSPLEAELQKRHKKLEELERQQEQQQQENLKAPEFVKVRENLRRTSCHGKEEKEV